MKILITGGAGFIGSNLVNHLVSSGHNITVIDSLINQVHGKKQNSYTLNEILGKCNFVNEDINNFSVLKKLVLEAEILVHLASYTGTAQSMYQKDLYWNTNVNGTNKIYQILKKNKNNLKKIILTSSRSVYGEGDYQYNDGTKYTSKLNLLKNVNDKFDFYCNQTNKKLLPIAVKETSSISPKSYYAETKFEQEKILKKISSELEISCVVLRLQNVYGEGQSLINPYTGIFSVFSTRILNNSKVEIYEDGLQSRDFIYVTDVVMLINQVISNKSDSNFHIFNVGSGKRTKIIDIAKKLYKSFEKKPNYFVSGKSRVGDIRHNFSDISKIKEKFKFKISIDLDQGIKKYSRWVLKQKIEQDYYEKSINELKSKGLYK